MPIVADAAVAVRGDMSKFNNDLTSGLNKGTKQAEGFGSKLKGALTPGNLMAAGGIGFGLAQVTSFMGDAVAGAAEYEDALSAVGVIFGEEMIPQIKEWGDEAAANFGAGNTEAIKAANVVATLGKSAGLAGEDLVGFSTDMVQLGGDLASMFGGSTTDAITAVGAALRGESEPIRRYGVLLDDATLRQRAFEMGLIDTTNEALKPNIKVLAAQAEILSQTTDAQGDFLRTSDGMANTQRRLQAEFSNVVGVLGEKLLPIALEFATFVGDDLLPILSTLIDIGGDIGGVFAAVGDGLSAVSDAGREINQFVTGSSREWDNLSQAQRDMVLESEASWQTYQDQTRSGTVYESEALKASQANWQAHQDIITDHSNTTANALPQAVLDNWEDIKQSGADAVTAYAQGLFENQDAINDEVAALLTHLDERLTPGEEISRLRGQKMQLMLARGIQAELGDAGAVAAIDDLIAKINGQLAGLNGYGAGKNLVITLASGIRQNLGTASLASAALAGVIRGPVFIESEPKDPNSPLRGITKIGGNIVQTIADGIYGALGTGTGASRALAGALMPSLATPAFAGGSVGAAGIGPTYIVNVNGVQRTVKSEEEAMQALHDLGAFNGDGRLS